MTTNLTTLSLQAPELQELDAILNLTRLICGKIITPVLCIMGFMANIVNVIVLTRAWMNSSTNVYLTAVAVCDLLYLLFSCLFSIWLYPNARQFAPYAYTVTLIHGTANLFSNTTTWLTVCFTLERYIAVSSPMIGRRICTQQRARYAVIGTFLISFLLTFPDYLKRRVRSPSESNSTQPSLQFTVIETSIKPYLVKLGYDYMNQIVFVFIPMLLLIIFNSLLVRSVIHANRSRKRLVRHTNTKSTSSEHFKCHPKTPAPQDHTLIVKDALQDSLKTTLNLTSGITEKFGQSQTGANKAFLSPTSTSASISNRRPILGEQQRITIMLITIVMAFVMLQLPSTVPTITDNLWKAQILIKTEKAERYLYIYSNISNVLLILNAAMNFVFYSLFSAKFRQTCCLIFQRYACIQTLMTDTKSVGSQGRVMQTEAPLGADHVTTSSDKRS